MAQTPDEPQDIESQIDDLVREMRQAMPDASHGTPGESKASQKAQTPPPDPSPTQPKPKPKPAAAPEPAKPEAEEAGAGIVDLTPAELTMRIQQMIDVATGDSKAEEGGGQKAEIEEAPAEPPPPTAQQSLLQQMPELAEDSSPLDLDIAEVGSGSGMLDVGDIGSGLDEIDIMNAGSGLLDVGSGSGMLNLTHTVDDDLDPEQLEQLLSSELPGGKMPGGPDVAEDPAVAKSPFAPDYPEEVAGEITEDPLSARSPFAPEYPEEVAGEIAEPSAAGDPQALSEHVHHLGQELDHMFGDHHAPKHATHREPVDDEIFESEEELAQALEAKIEEVQKSQLTGTATAVAEELGLDDLAYIKEDRITEDDLEAITSGADPSLSPPAEPLPQRLKAAFAAGAALCVAALGAVKRGVTRSPTYAVRFMETLNLPLEVIGTPMVVRNMLGFIGLHSIAAAVCLYAYIHYGEGPAMMTAGILLIPLAAVFYLMFLSRPLDDSI